MLSTFDFSRNRMLEDIHGFVQSAVRSKLKFYNESTLQMELALFLRHKHATLKIELERPITSFGVAPETEGKKEIDICITDPNENRLAAIEIKMPLNGRVPESMFDFCRDVRFCEWLVMSGGFKSAYALILAPKKAFREGRETERIYSFFRNAGPLTGKIEKPTGARDRTITIIGTYKKTDQRIARTKGIRKNRLLHHFIFKICFIL